MTRGDGQTKRWSTLRVVGFAFFLVLIGFVVLLWGFSWLETGDWRALFDGAKISAAPPRNATALAAALAVAVAGGVAYTRQRTAEETYELERQAGERAERNLQLEREKNDQLRAEAIQASERAEANLELERGKNDQGRIEALRARYTVAAAQLGDRESSAIRLAGVYAMAALADDWLVRGRPSEAQTCINVLCSYLRAAPPLRISQNVDGPAAVDRGELEVRQSIASVISARLRQKSDPAWWGMTFDFTGAVFDDGRYDFSGSEFRDTTRMKFSGVRVEGGMLNFRHTRFTGGGVDFIGARLEGGHVNFGAAQLELGSIMFNGARIKGGTVAFEFTKLSPGGVVSFANARIEGGTVALVSLKCDRGRVIFTRALISSGTLDFTSTNFPKGSTLLFEGTRMIGGTIHFDQVSFAEGSIKLRHVHLGNTAITGPWGAGPPPDRWPADGRGKSN